MESCLDKIENFLSAVSINCDHSVFESTTLLSITDPSSSVSKTTIQSIKCDDPQISSLCEWIHSRSQHLSAEPTVKESEPDLMSNGLNMVENVATALETIVQDKEELRHHFKTSHAENTLPLHFDHHKSFFHMINCLSSVGNKYEDYSMLTSEKVLSSLHQHLLKLEETEKKETETQQVSINTAADTEEVRRKKL